MLRLLQHEACADNDRLRRSRCGCIRTCRCCVGMQDGLCWLTLTIISCRLTDTSPFSCWTSLSLSILSSNCSSCTSASSSSSSVYISSSHIGLIRRLAIMRWASCCIVHFVETKLAPSCKFCPNLQEQKLPASNSVEVALRIQIYATALSAQSAMMRLTNDQHVLMC